MTDHPQRGLYVGRQIIVACRASTMGLGDRPYTSNAGKNAGVRVKKVGQPEVTEIRTWGAHERMAVRRG